MVRLPLFVAALGVVASSHAVLLDSSVLQTIPSGSTSHYYTGYGMTLNDSVGTEPISGTWPGVWIGSQNYEGSNAIEFVFDSAVTQVDFYFSAMSGGSTAYDEGFMDIMANAAGSAVSLANASGTTLTGDDVTTTIGDGRGQVSVTASTAFSKVSFSHWNTGQSNGTVIEWIEYAPVPEPASMALLGLGFAALAKRRRR